ncbi:hypothetical protein FOA52_009754 [Chlamydomonas sp. UWO 241]|nr:hypothetical protein FOA52_009754 [Chlamydomonas sp. UWO 241]
MTSVKRGTTIPAALTEVTNALKTGPASAKKAGPVKAKTEGEKTLDGLYAIMTSLERKLGGGEGIEGIYGSITQKGTQRILSSLHHNCGLGPDSVLVDIGAGLGRPLLHAMHSHGIKGSFGIELDTVKVAKAHSFISGTLRQMAERGLHAPHAPDAPNGQGPCPPEIHCTAVEDWDTLEPATHAYSFWEGIPADGRRALGRLFVKSRTLRGIAVVQRAMRGNEPAALMRELGFGPLMLISNFAVSMSGSGASFQAYMFAKVAPHSGIDALLSPVPRSVPAPTPDHDSDAPAVDNDAEDAGGDDDTAPVRDAHGGGGATASAAAGAGKAAGRAAAEGRGAPCVAAAAEQAAVAAGGGRQRSARLTAKAAVAVAAAAPAPAPRASSAAPSQRTLPEVAGYAPRRARAAGAAPLAGAITKQLSPCTRGAAPPASVPHP